MKTEDGQFILSGAKRSCSSIRELLHFYQKEALRTDGYTFKLSRCCPPSLKGQSLHTVEVTVAPMQLSPCEDVHPSEPLTGVMFTLFICGIYCLLTHYLTFPAAANWSLSFKILLTRHTRSNQTSLMFCLCMFPLYVENTAPAARAEAPFLLWV